jgi:antitoxin component of MazEF toxin-antitoxin module
MSTVVLTKWGNSIGIRIPAPLIKEAHLKPGIELTIVANKKGGFTLVPVERQQENWLEMFNAIADQNQDTLLLDVPNAFDDDWTW